MATDRPEWASGPEWEGWEWTNHTSMTRTFNAPIGPAVRLLTCCIDQFGMQVVSITGDDMTVPGRNNASSFLTAANALAEAAGGWA